MLTLWVVDSHNPPNVELLEFADEYGILVLDENRHFGDSPQWKEDQKDMILRDRNHPSIVMWSICNEAGCQFNAKGIDKVAAEFKDIIQGLDGKYNDPESSWAGYQRPIIGAQWMTPMLDFASAHYTYDLSAYHQQHPNQSILESESCGCVTDRNEYVDSPSTGHCSAYNGCPWKKTNCPDGCWKPIAETEYIMGSFAWTGFDYKGESTPYGWPDVNSVNFPH